MTRADGPHAERDWEVVAMRLHNPGDSADGYDENVIARSSEDEARRVFADTAAMAADEGYERVLLRSRGQDVESWPPATGWTS
jgi:hypothetical protein